MDDKKIEAIAEIARHNDRHILKVVESIIERVLILEEKVKQLEKN